MKTYFTIKELNTLSDKELLKCINFAEYCIEKIEYTLSKDYIEDVYLCHILDNYCWNIGLPANSTILIKDVIRRILDANSCVSFTSITVNSENCKGEAKYEDAVRRTNIFRLNFITQLETQATKMLSIREKKGIIK